MKYIDTHAHLNFEEKYPDFDELEQKTKSDDVRVINVGTGEATSQRAVEIANGVEHMWAIIGLHPIYAAPSYATELGEDFNPEFYQGLLASSEKIVGVGECGFDYFHGNAEGKAKQEREFRAQIEFALKHNLPLMLHIRPSEGSMDAYEDTLAILATYKSDNQNLRGQAHFFAGTAEIAERFIDLGFYISFTGVITFARMYEKLVKAIPMDRILSETDCPYVSPHPYRGERNEPSHVREIVRKMAKIKGVEEEVMAEQIRQNVKTLYGI